MRIAVVGLGHIGLPLAVQYASRGHDVLGIDVAPAIVDAINRGESPHRDEQALIDRVPQLVADGRLRAATWDGADALREMDAVVVIVPVVVDAQRQIDFGPIDAATRDIAKRIGPGALVVYETTLPVGTTRDRFGPMLAEGSGLELDRDLFLAFGRPVVKAHLPLDHVHHLVAGVDVELAAVVAAARDEGQGFRFLPQHVYLLLRLRQFLTSLQQVDDRHLVHGRSPDIH